MRFFQYIWLLLFVLAACENKKTHEQVAFKVLKSDRTGLNFSNRLSSSDSFNLFKYMYFYNGAGVAAGDFNNDGLIDLFFASNQGYNSMYLNKGKLQFAKVNMQAGIPLENAWSTGVSLVDINNDGLLDIYVSRVGKYQVLHGKNQFLICQGISKEGIPFFKDKAAEYGIDFSGFGTQAAFMDYDLDGDLDLFLLNHSVHENGTFRARSEFTGTYHPTAGSRLFRNDGNVFTDVTKTSGINSSAIGYGLGIAVSDINLDGYPDIYIGNDFHENDYLYINQKNGRFKDVAADEMMHTSQYTMGVDVADASNDGYPDIITVDMLPSDPYVLKRSLGEDNYDIFYLKIRNGYNYQYTRNNLQYNRRNGKFSEIGLYSGVAATDWSWSPLWMDFDNDGRKDLFISNGIPKRMNDIDYINYVSDQEIQEKIRDNKLSEKDEVLIKKFPKIKIPNKFYHNNGNMEFKDLEHSIEDDEGTYSNGAVYADFDNDGDLDVVVNNIDEDALLYENKTNDNAKLRPYLSVSLKGPASNINAVGSRFVVFSGDEVRTYEKYPVRGFLSSMEGPMHVGLYNSRADSMFLIWPDNSYQRVQVAGDQTSIKLNYQAGLPKFEYSKILLHYKNESDSFEDETSKANLLYVHKENSFPEFDREPLMPHMVSSEGPALAVADVNNDGLDDVFIGSSKGSRNALFIQKKGAQFEKITIPDLAADSTYEDIDACWADVNNDKFSDLIIASGGNEYYGKERHLLPRVYLNDTRGGFVRKGDAFSDVYQTASCIAPCDFNGDGRIDLFVGGRAVPWEYGKMPPSYLLVNDGTGKFTDVTKLFSAELSEAGFVTDAVWFDINEDGSKDLVVCSEWGTVDAYLKKGNKFEKKVICGRKGWWNAIVPCDVNGDGKMDLVAGNLGLNSRLQASDREPVRLYYNDFDDNGKKEQVLTYYIDGKEIPFANKSEMEKQMPGLRKKFLYAQDFAKASLRDIFGEGKLESAELYSANFFSSCILMNKGQMQFDIKALPWQAQLSPVRDALVLNANKDSLPDLMLVGNYYANNIEMGRNDASYGSILLNKGNGNFKSENINGLAIKGESRHVREITVDGEKYCIIARNSDSTLLVRTRGHKAS